MCGIVGVIQYKSPIDRSVRAKALRILFSDIMLRTEPRGDDATGIYQVHTDGDWMMAKKGEKVTKWLYLDRESSTDPVTYKDFMETWEQHPRDVAALVGHCRKATVGSRGQDNDDNHPFAVQVDERNAILGVHNGTLNNHELIFQNLKEHLPRQGEVDSEAIFHLLHHATDHGARPIDEKALKFVGERLDGAFAVITMNTKFPNQVAAFRDGRPMEMAMIRPLNVVVLASEKKFVDQALLVYEFYRQTVDWNLPQLESVDRILTEKDYRIFDTTLEFPESGKLEWSSFDTISVKGAMRSSIQTPPHGWKAPVKAATPSYNAYGVTGNYTYHPPAPQTAKISKAGGGGEGTSLPVKETGNSSAPTVTVTAEIEREIPDEKKDAQKAFVRARSLGVCPHYDLPREVAVAIGKTENELDGMTTVNLANEVQAAGFNLGYAMGRFDTRSELEEVRKKGRDQLSKMERTADKQKRAEKRIWEMKTLLQLSMALAECGYPITERNLSIALATMREISKDRKSEVSRTAKGIFEDAHAQDAIRGLVEDFREAGAKKGQRTAGASEILE